MLVCLALWVSLLLPCYLSAAAQPADSSSASCRSVPDSEVIARDAIRNAGIARLGDILTLSDRWYSTTIDGYTRDAQASGLSPLSNPRWGILIDGTPVDIGLFGKKSLDALPIHINEIECVEFISRPQIAAGELQQSGALHIYTHRPDSGMTLAASVAAGNEVNDPGPFAYTPSASANIDRIGPIGTGVIEIRSKGRFARLSGKLDEFHVTDQQIDLRAKQLYNIDSKPRISSQAVSLTAGATTRWGRQSIVAGRSETNDLLFLETFGLEIPSKRRVDLLAASGSLQLGGGQIRYRGSYVSHELLERPNAGDISFDFRKRVISGGLESEVGSGPFRMTIGGSVDFVEAETEQNLADARTMITRLFGLAEAKLADRVLASVFASWLQSDDRAAVSMMPSLRVMLPADRWISASASFANRTLEMDASLWRWTFSGYSLPERPLHDDDPQPSGSTAGTINMLHEPPEPQVFTADAEFGGRMPQGIEYLVGTYYRRSLSDYLADHDIAFSNATTGFLTRTTVVGYVAGEIIGVHASLGLNLLKGFSQRITYVAEGAVSGDSHFQDGQARIPSQRIALTTTFAPNDRFSLYARARYQPKTEWREYEAAASASGGFYPLELSDRMLVDVAATKRLWRDHLVATLSIRNLLNESLRAHPAGAVFDMSFHFSLRASLNSESGL